jgi:hypothetical protein
MFRYMRIFTTNCVSMLGYFTVGCMASRFLFRLTARDNEIHNQNLAGSIKKPIPLKDKSHGE